MLQQLQPAVEMDDKAFLAAYTQARVYLMQNPKWAFYSALLMLLMDKMDHPEVPTAGVDGKYLYINREFFMSLESKPRRAGLLAHESLHVALKHMIRGASIPMEMMEKFQEACDHVINLMLVEDGFEPIHPDWYCDPAYKNMTAEQIYKLLLEQPPKPQQNDGGGGAVPGGIGNDILQPKGQDSGEGQTETIDQKQAMADLSCEIDVMLRQAEQQAINAGLKPGDIPQQIRAYLDSLVKPKLPMATHLRQFMRAISRDDYSWRKLNRRFSPMILPGLRSDHKLLHIAFAFDMSGSVSRKDYTRYMSELYGVMRQMKPDKLTLIQFDTNIKSVDTIKSVRDMANIELRGRGGTNVNPLMEWAKIHKPTALIVFTDGEYSHPVEKPKCPVLWLIHGHRKERFHCDFGKTVLFDV
jgi:predicted metal-dependent peptidase